jgi:hypothetical protein
MEVSLILNTPLEIFQLNAPTDLTLDRKPNYPFLYEAVHTAHDIVAMKGCLFSLLCFFSVLTVCLVWTVLTWFIIAAICGDKNEQNYLPSFSFEWPTFRA